MCFGKQLAGTLQALSIVGSTSRSVVCPFQGGNSNTVSLTSPLLPINALEGSCSRTLLKRNCQMALIGTASIPS